MKIITVIIIFSAAATYSQINDSASNPSLQKIFSDTIKSITIENDTSKKNIQEYPPIKLKYELNTMLQSSGKIFPYYKFDFTAPEYFSDDERASGLDQEQLLAYKKNKNVFRDILAKEYYERWWDRVKGIDELLGIPREAAMIIRLITVFYLYGLSY